MTEFTFEKAWEKLRESPGGERNPFVDPYGPTEECFSANDVARMFRLGALARDMAHLRRCDECRGRIMRFVQVKYQPLPAMKGQRRWLRWPAPQQPAVAAPAGNALVHVSAPWRVQQDGVVLGIQVQFLAGPRGCEPGTEVLLGGPTAVVASGTVVEIDENGIARARFDSLNVSRDVMNALGRHARVTQQFVIMDKPDGGLVGRSNVDFERA